MKATELLKEQSSAEKTVRPLYSDEELKQLKEEETKELEKINQPISGTLVVLRKGNEEQHFGTVGRYRVTGIYETIEEVEEEVQEIKENKLYPLLVAMSDLLYEEILLQDSENNIKTEKEEKNVN